MVVVDEGLEISECLRPPAILFTRVEHLLPQTTSDLLRPYRAASGIGEYSPRASRF